jgi:hypothetical protein
MHKKEHPHHNLSHSEEVKGGEHSHMHHKKQHDHHLSEAKKHAGHMMKAMKSQHSKKK